MNGVSLPNGTEIVEFNQKEITKIMNNVHQFFCPEKIERYKDNTIVIYWVDGSSTMLHMDYKGDTTNPNYRINEFSVALAIRMFNIADPYIKKFYEKEVAVDKEIDYNSLPNLNGRHPKKEVLQ